VGAFQADVHVELKPLVNDPAGLVIRDALRHIGFDGVEGVRSGKYLSIQLEAANQPEAEYRVREMCRRLLANPVIEDFRVEVREAATAG
jgi:phosphoribosylformylglycinamidine synthase subunit PurS